LTIINNKRLAAEIKPPYSVQQIRKITEFLEQKGTLTFSRLSNGLFPAAAIQKNKSYTGYSYVWVRDNIHIAHAHYAVGFVEKARKTVRTLMEYFIKYRERFLDIIEGKEDPAIAINRPHVRFEGETLEEVNEKWAHAQNDALGYFLWLYCKLVNEGQLSPTQVELNMLAMFPHYFQAIQYWKDEDSGHWEEKRKISASSIGVVVAGLQELEKLISGRLRVGKQNDTLTTEFVKSLAKRGAAALELILPAECVQPELAKHRPYDGALLFLIYPLQVVQGEMAEKILGNVAEHLQGEYGIRRYLGDSYWAPDYKDKLEPAKRTVDFSDDMAHRDQFLPTLGQEAQWCIFDPIISCIYGKRFKVDGTKESLEDQAKYLNRSLGQITQENCQQAPAFRCPELYYLEHGIYVPNDHIPLLWTQANLMLGLKMMEESCT